MSCLKFEDEFHPYKERIAPNAHLTPASEVFMNDRAPFESPLMTEPSTDSVGRSPSGSVGVISKVLLILEALQNSSVGLGLKAICDATGINKSTAHRFLKHLEREGYLLRTEVGAYLIGRRLAQMSACASRSATLQAVARPILAELWRSTQEAVNLGVLDHGTLLYVDVMESSHKFRLVSGHDVPSTSQH
jgi:IclR-like helix-turn-helix domain-containing protein